MVQPQGAYVTCTKGQYLGPGTNAKCAAGGNTPPPPPASASASCPAVPTLQNGQWQGPSNPFNPFSEGDSTTLKCSAGYTSNPPNAQIRCQSLFGSVKLSWNGASGAECVSTGGNGNPFGR